MEPRPARPNNSRNYLLAALLILAALNVLLLYFYYQERETNKTKDATIAVKTEEVLATKTKLDSISNQLDLKIAEIQKLGGSVDSLIAIRQELEMDKKSLRNNVGTFDTSKYDAKIKRYEALLTEKDKELVRLREENGILTQENTNLAQENTGLKTDKQVLADSVREYSTQNRELAEKVTIASALRAEGVTVNALNSRGKEDDGGRYKAKRIDKIRVTFTLAPNAVARQNEKDVYMRIVDPSGAVIFDMATGSGEFTSGGQNMIYTSAQRIQFDNSGQRVDFIYGRGGQRFPEGKHVIELYSEGFKIGQGEFTVR
jgi:regulator of replication initiation timing